MFFELETKYFSDVQSIEICDTRNNFLNRYMKKPIEPAELIVRFSKKWNLLFPTNFIFHDRYLDWTISYKFKTFFVKSSFVRRKKSEIPQ